MFKNYLLSAFRHLFKNKALSFINIAGLAVGMAVAMLIGLWISDELSYDHFSDHYDHIARVRQNQVVGGEIHTSRALPIPLADELQKSYGSNFKYVVLSSWNWYHILNTGGKSLSQTGNFMSPQAADLFSLKMIKGGHT